MRAIVLTRKDFRENDQIISVYTREKGKIELLARGVKKIISKQSSYLEPFSLVEIGIEPGKEIYHLTKVQSIEYFVKIRNDLEKSLTAGYAVKFVNRMTESGEKDGRIFDLILSGLKFLEINNNHYFLDIFVLKFLSLLGFAPELNHCVVCERENGFFNFYPAGGGFVCENCFEIKKKLGEIMIAGEVKERDILNAWLNNDWGEAGKIYSNKIHRIIFEFAGFHCGKKLGEWGKTAELTSS